MNKYQMPYYNFIPLAETANKFPENSEISSFDFDENIMVVVMLRRPTNINNLTMREYADQVLLKKESVLSRNEFSRYFSASQEDVDQITAFAEHFGMFVSKVHRDSAKVKLIGSISTLNQAFKVDIKKIVVDGVTKFGHAEPISIPESLSDIITNVMGLDSLFDVVRDLAVAKILDQTAQPMENAEPMATPGIKPITPIQAATAYNFPKVSGQGECIAIIQYDGGYRQDNMVSSFAAVGLAVPKLVDVSVNDGFNKNFTQDEPDVNNYSVEVAVDIFVAGCVVPDATIVTYFNGSTFFNKFWADPIDEALHDTVNNPSVISISWGIAETLIDSRIVQTVNEVLAQSIILGKTICCASGDWGASSDRTNLGVIFPASSPYVLAVGGTNLVLNDNDTIKLETAWSYSGGGVSIYNALPSWQEGLSLVDYDPLTGAGEPRLLSEAGARAVPDVSANSAVESGYSFYSFYYSGGIQFLNARLRVGGTSVAAPLIAALMIQLDQTFGKPLGFANTLFYNNPNAFNDIVSGNNSYQPDEDNIIPSNIGYDSTVGWDAVTGLGSPNGSRLVSAVTAVPFADNISITVDQNTPITISPLVGTSVNKITIVRAPFYGTATARQEAIKIDYISNRDYYGDDSILFTVSTPFKESNPALISIKVLSALPIVSTVTAIVSANSVNNIINPRVTNFYDKVDIYSTLETKGVATASGTVLYYTPPINYAGTDSFQYTASSPTGTSQPGNVFITIPIPPPPEVFDIQRNIIYNSSNNFINPNVSGIYTIITATVSSVNSGTVYVNNNVIFYSPPRNYIGRDGFRYFATGPGGIDTATVVINVLTTTSAIQSYDVSQYVLENSRNNLINLSKTNSTGTLTVVVTATHGITTVTNNFIYYTPNRNYVGFDRFSYKLTNNYGTSTNGSVNISVNSSKYTPLVFESSATIIENTVDAIITPLASNSATGVIVNSNPLFGVVESSGTNFLYTPKYSFTGIDYFYFSAFNTAGISETARFYIRVTPIVTPIARAVYTTVNYNSVSSPILPNVTNPYNTTTVVVSPLRGITTTSDTVIYYTPPRGYSGTDTFYYTVGNLKGKSDLAQVTVTVSPSIGFNISPASGNLRRGSINNVYTTSTFTGTNGTPPFTTSITAGSLPSGLTLTNNVLSGTPVSFSANLYRFSVTITDSSTPTNLVSTGSYVLDIAKTSDTLITTSSYNTLHDNNKNLITTIYGSTVTSQEVISETLIFASDWNEFYDDIQRCVIHQEGVGSGLGFLRPEIGNYISLGLRDAMNDRILGLTDTYTTVHPSQLLLDTGGFYTRNTSTVELETYIISYEWSSSTQAGYFFNLGGYIQGTLLNTSTNYQLSQTFNHSNYTNNTQTSATSALSVIDGTGSISISNKNNVKGNIVASIFRVSTSTQNSPARYVFTASDYYSTDDTGGIEAPRPVVELFQLNGQLSARPIGTVTVKGNESQTVDVVLTNSVESPITITQANVSYQAKNDMPLTVTMLNLPITVAANSTSTFQVKLQNFTAVGGEYAITINILAYLVVIDDIEILVNEINLPLPVDVQFGITVTPNTLTSGTIYTNTYFDVVVRGYGGVMKAVGITDNQDFKEISKVFEAVTNTNNPRVCNLTMMLDTTYVVNGTYSQPLLITGYSDPKYLTLSDPIKFFGGIVIGFQNLEIVTGYRKTDSKDISHNLLINVTDRHLGYWIGPAADPNSIMGFSYDVFNGVRRLTMAFGTVPSVASTYPLYITGIEHSLRRPDGYNNTLHNSVDDKTAGRAYEKFAASGNSTFFNSFGIKGKNSVVDNIFIRNTGTYNTTISTAEPGTLYLDNNVLTEITSPNPTGSSVIVRTIAAGWHTIQWIGQDLPVSIDNPNLYSVTLNYAWSSFMNKYAVWTNPSNTAVITVNVTRTVNIPTDGNYRITVQADNHMTLFIDGVQRIKTSDFRAFFGISLTNTITLPLTTGNHVFVMIATNDGGPAGFAVLVENASTNVAVWNTRSNLIPTPAAVPNERRVAISVTRDDTDPYPDYVVWSTLNLAWGTLAWHEIDRVTYGPYISSVATAADRRPSTYTSRPKYPQLGMIPSLANKIAYEKQAIWEKQVEIIIGKTPTAQDPNPSAGLPNGVYDGLQVFSYGDFFTNGNSAVGMWSVSNDGSGVLNIRANNYSKISSNATDNNTMVRVQRDAFYYYSKWAGRRENSFSLNGDTQTYLFLGFKSNGEIMRTVVGIPTPPPPPPPPPPADDGCKIICTKLHELGYLPDHIYEADEKFGQWLRETDPYAYYGYVKWASVVVDWMEKDGPQCMFWIRDKQKRKEAQQAMAIAWARRIATPWAQHMAFLMGVEKEDNKAGRLIMKTGLWVSRIIGKYTKTTKPTKSPVLGYIMWATFGIFWLLAGVK